MKVPRGFFFNYRFSTKAAILKDEVFTSCFDCFFSNCRSLCFDERFGPKKNFIRYTIEQNE